MKVCKHCKKSIANNAKTCKYCKKPVNSKATLQRKKTTTTDAPKKIENEKKVSKKNHYNRIIEEGKKRLELEKQKKSKQKEKKLKKVKNFLEDKKNTTSKKKINPKSKSKNKHVNERVNLISKIKQQFVKKTSNEKPIVKVEKSNEEEIVETVDFLNEVEDIEILETNEEKEELIELQKEEKAEQEEQEEQNIEKTDNKKRKVSSKKKFTIIILVVLSVFFTTLGVRWMQRLTNSGPVTEINRENRGKVFNMSETIEYQGMKYQVVAAERSKGTAYKTPKDGYEFIVVTLRLENTSDEKQKYDNKSWRLKNSVGQETGKIFLPIKDHPTLYSGSLVIGGQKTGSLVFEQLLEDPELELNFYDEEEIAKNEKLPEEEQQDLKKVFGFKIKVNKNDEVIIKD